MGMWLQHANASCSIFVILVFVEITGLSRLNYSKSKVMSDVKFKKIISCINVAADTEIVQ